MTIGTERGQPRPISRPGNTMTPIRRPEMTMDSTPDIIRLHRLHGMIRDRHQTTGQQGNTEMTEIRETDYHHRGNLPLTAFLMIYLNKST